MKEPKDTMKNKHSRLVFSIFALLPSSCTASDAKRFRNANDQPHRFALYQSPGKLFS